MGRHHRLKKKRTLAAVIILAAALAIGIPVLASVVKEANKITGTEWFFMQREYIEQFEELADETDTVVTLYITGSIGEEDFITHLGILEDELAVMEAAYKRDEEENPVRNGSHTYLSKKGCESVPACFEAFEGLYGAMEENSGDTDQLSYVYLAYHQEMIDAVSDYTAVMAVLCQDYFVEEDDADLSE